MDESQAAFVYFFAVGNICAYCWLGNELSEEVRKLRSQITRVFKFLDIFTNATFFG